MSLRKNLVGAGMTVALLSALGVTAFAQQPQGAPADRGMRTERMGRKGGIEGRERMRGPKIGKHLFHVLDLTDAQKEQIRAAGEQNREATKPQREELRQLAEKRRQGTLTAEEEARARTLREGIATSMRSAHANLLTILTPEQKARLEQLRNERKEGHKGMRDGHKKGREQQTPPPAIQ